MIFKWYFEIKKKVYREKKEEYEQVKKDRDRLNVEIKKLTEKFAPILERKKEIDRLVEQQKNTSKNKARYIFLQFIN